MTNLLETKNLVKKFKDQLVLDGINLHIPENKVYCLLGPNGAGKTTLMKILTGMIPASSGQVEFAGHEWTRSDLAKIGSLIENAPLYSNLTAKENLQVICRLRGTSENEIPGILQTVGLNNTGNKLTKNFSLGMKERLGIGLALVGHPKLLILDEPTNGLDPLGIQQLRNLIAEFKQKDITIIISSHMLSEVEHLADNIGIIGGGKLLLEQPYDHEIDLEKLFNSTLEKAGVMYA
ncbi:MULTISPECIES: lantibiotic protection ABC transporter ATP-binding subunit [unclassified Lactobacillus]|uniref:lantibiotic protection ABC transporter ATP-binding subunit n=1 Tax=unclassified Lactobacillus TaxID=2620435 RepID=UPI000EFCE455|nr:MULTISPECIES: lantibiotic protection ABC transporter ATP-binding subunit [unclassified Lactobacillus]RMC24150.1 lantibiotic protection ABC transporter ATP-binding subunit [Lactobacillus sp. ESL0247]RMC28723.1 lantibiotic protection ABC transporter ATP-binding subunit [Lactobacillus sp. ESL0246]RMC31380.1 lantibiotic protection ABC transporter ATP-binding subunit [Lactobacillus sp. ESL0245]